MFLGGIIFVNLDHYLLDADYKHGMHFTALPTAWVSGFDKSSTLRIGSSTAWVTETTGATAGFLEYTGQGPTTFERAMDRDERLMAVLYQFQFEIASFGGARLLTSRLAGTLAPPSASRGLEWCSSKVEIVLGARLLEGQRRVGETAQPIELRQSGENSILNNVAMSASTSLTQVLRWAY